MTVILEFTVPSRAFEFGKQLGLPPDVELDVEQVVPVEDTVMPFSWVSGDHEAFESSIDDDDVDSSLLVDDEQGGRKLYRLEWDASDSDLMDAIMESHGVVLNAVGTDEEWTFNVRFEEREDMSGFHERCAEVGLGIEVTRVYNPIEVSGEFREGMTSTQRSTLLDAFDAGYFEIPRQTSLVELAEEYDVSDQAVSERLRRVTSQLIDSALVVEEESLHPVMPSDDD